MSFIIEDGTGISGATSLVSVEYADEYFTDRLNETWLALTEAKKQSSLIQATAYVTTQYRWKGSRLVSSQGQAFPRKNVPDPDGNETTGVPVCIKDAVCELAVRASSGSLIEDPSIDEGGRPIKTKALQVGSLRKTIEFASPGEYVSMARYPAVDALICPWLVQDTGAYANGVKVVGADVSGVSNATMRSIQRDIDRYTGPMNENQKDVSKSGVGII